MLVATGAGILLGMVSIRWREGCEPPYPWLYGLSVAASFRRQGVGRALVEAVEAVGSRKGFEAISLDVDVEDSRAIAFYQRLGYSVVRSHLHRWRSLDPRTGTVQRSGTAATWIMRHELTSAVDPER